jgi:hypothetical protein
MVRSEKPESVFYYMNASCPSIQILKLHQIKDEQTPSAMCAPIQELKFT